MNSNDSENNFLKPNSSSNQNKDHQKRKTADNLYISEFNKLKNNSENSYSKDVGNESYNFSNNSLIESESNFNFEN